MHASFHCLSGNFFRVINIKTLQNINKTQYIEFIRRYHCLGSIYISLNVFQSREHLLKFSRNISQSMQDLPVHSTVCQKTPTQTILAPSLLMILLSSRRFKSHGKHPTPKIPPTKMMSHYDIHGSISDEDSAKQFVYALSPKERSRLLQELEKFRDLEGKTEQGSKPSRQQLKQVALHQAFPFIGFGFLDNLLMICFGEYIDVTLGTAFGISTMAAAALGNLLSDVGGIGSASYVEILVTKLGVRAPQISPEQVEMRSTRWASSLGKAAGVAFGCLLGMFPLLLFSGESKEKDKKTTVPE